MKKTDYNTGWSLHAWIEVKKNSTYDLEGSKCESGNELEDEFLILSKINFRHRGTETNELYKYNRNSTPSEYQCVWSEWDEIKNAKIKEVFSICSKYNLGLPFNHF